LANLKKYNIAGEEIGTFEISDEVLKIEANHNMVKDYIMAIRKNKRQWSANTKDKSEVKATGKKPHKQKGLGRARQGSLVSPQYKGGGVVFGPKANKRKSLIKINKKEKRLAIRFLISDRMRENRVVILDEFLEKPKTKKAFEFFQKLELENKRVLVLANCEDNYVNMRKSIKNIQKKHFTFVSNVNGYELALSMNIVVLGSNAMEKVLTILEGSKNEK